jgi:hypothetical protein
VRKRFERVFIIPVQVERRFSDPIRIESGCELSLKRTAVERTDHSNSPKNIITIHKLRCAGVGSVSNPERAATFADDGADRAIKAGRGLTHRCVGPRGSLVINRGRRVCERCPERHFGPSAVNKTERKATRNSRITQWKRNCRCNSIFQRPATITASALKSRIASPDNLTGASQGEPNAIEREVSR